MFGSFFVLLMAELFDMWWRFWWFICCCRQYGWLQYIALMKRWLVWKDLEGTKAPSLYFSSETEGKHGKSQQCSQCASRHTDSIKE